jgi:cytochrome c oxidase assembly protein subunit 15
MAQQHSLAPPAAAAAARIDPVRAWLFALTALVFLMVSLGGATRLTGSGLSITQWQPVAGVLPPLSEAAWQEAFERYREIPQYRHVNEGMSLAAFKRIYWWEWTHRFLGRLVGVAFLLPFLLFLAAGRIRGALVPRLAALFVLGGVQGGVGWYMVRSGLAERIDVSQYRLALHLSLAVLIFGALLWTSLSTGAVQVRSGPEPRARRAAAALIAALVFLQIVAGAFVAGLRAGAGYNTWPLMDGRLVPDGLGALEPWWANLFENALTVQFNHRMLAYAIAIAVAWHVWAVLRGSDGGTARASAAALGAAVAAQVALGIWTLLARVPLALGLAHQAGAVAVFGIAVWHLHALGRARQAGSR